MPFTISAPVLPGSAHLTANNGAQKPPVLRCLRNHHTRPPGLLYIAQHVRRATSVTLGLQTYANAWGKAWPSQSTGTITNKDCGLEPDPGAEDDVNPSEEENPSRWTYTCLRGINSLCSDLGIESLSTDVLVVRDDYGWLCRTMEDEVAMLHQNRGGPGCPSRPAFVLTGHPGIGKTTFLLYLLLYRLERRLDTAIQTTPETYILFDKTGAVTRDARKALRPPFILPKDCWALCLGGDKTPGEAIYYSRSVIVQAQAPRPERWSRWRTQLMAPVFVMDLPHALEVAAIARENELDASAAIKLLNTWGPCMSTILELLRDSSREDEHRSIVARSLAQYCANLCPLRLPSLDAQNLDIHTAVLIRPVRMPLDPLWLSSNVLYTPTPTLTSMCNEACKQAADEGVVAVEVFELSPFPAEMYF